MYINFIKDRQKLGYLATEDVKCGIYLVRISHSMINRTRRLVIIGIFGVTILFSDIKPSEAIGLSSPLPYRKIIQSNKNSNSSYYVPSIIESKMYEIILTNEEIEDLNFICYKLRNNFITVDQAILEIRGGVFYEWATLAFIIYMFSVQEAEGYIVPLPHQDPLGWLSGKYNFKGTGFSNYSPSTSTSLEMQKPASMPQEEYSAMTKSEKRQLKDPKGRDAIIQVKNRPQLDVRFNQVEFKTPKHGIDHNLPVDEKGKTPKTEENAIALRDSLVNMANRNITWYIDGQYQGGTERECDSVNLFDPDRQLIAVYEKKPDGSNLFLTTCKLTPAEVKHLKASEGNFLTEKMINELGAVSTNIQENTNNEL